jgi:hypothetical protein
MPSFKWVNFYPQSQGDTLLHHSLTCNIVNNGQMLVIGGSFPQSDAPSCDSPNTWGVHNVDLGKVSGKAWNSYNPNLTTYAVPPEVVSEIGGLYVSVYSNLTSLVSNFL